MPLKDRDGGGRIGPGSGTHRAPRCAPCAPRPAATARCAPHVAAPSAPPGARRACKRWVDPGRPPDRVRRPPTCVESTSSRAAMRKRSTLGSPLGGGVGRREKALQGPATGAWRAAHVLAPGSGGAARWRDGRVTLGSGMCEEGGKRWAATQNHAPAPPRARRPPASQQPPSQRPPPSLPPAGRQPTLVHVLPPLLRRRRRRLHLLLIHHLLALPALAVGWGYRGGRGDDGGVVEGVVHVDGLRTAPCPALPSPASHTRAARCSLAPRSPPHTHTPDELVGGVADELHRRERLALPWDERR